MRARTDFRVGQHVRLGSAIVEVCTERSSRYGGMYQVKHISRTMVDPGAVASAAPAQEWMLKPLTEVDLCRIPQHGCGLIHVNADYMIAEGRR